MLQPWQTGKIIRIEQEAAQTRRFWIQLPALEAFDFEPGQFVTLDLPIHDKPNKRWRSYSIASWPDGTNVIELVIVLLEGGAGTNYLFSQCTVGSELTLRGPQGIFTLPSPIGKDLFFICTGTGIAPFRAMSHHILNHNIAHKDIYLIFGCRHFEDALYRQELTELGEKIPNFHYIPTFSREKQESEGPFIHTGYVHAIYEELCRQQTAVMSEQQTPGMNGQEVTAAVLQHAQGLPLPHTQGLPPQHTKGLAIPHTQSLPLHDTQGLTLQPDLRDTAGRTSPMQEPLRPAYFFLCGWKNMIDEAKTRIQALGYDRKSIHQELYG